MGSRSAWVKLLCQAGGFQGLMGGQALDLYPSVAIGNPGRYYEEMNYMKTAGLISSGIQGVFVLKKQETDEMRKLQRVGDLIGKAFQLSDDLQDFTDANNSSNFAVSLGHQVAQKRLKTLSEEALDLVAEAGFSNSLLSQLIIFNQKRCEK